MKKIIIISGKQLSGKDTVASTLLECLPNFKISPLAVAIKLELGEEKSLTFNEVDRNKFLYRAELIELGNRRRAEDPNYWLDKVTKQDGDLIVSDLRLLYEYEIFKKLGAISVRVNSDREARAHRGVIVEENDLTETELDNVQDWDYVIENNDDIDKLKEETKKLAKLIEEKLFSHK